MTTILSSTWAQGVDVSGYDPNMNFQVIKAQDTWLKFGLAKVTEGTGYISEQYAIQVKGFDNIGDPWGSYHYWWANLDGKTQGQWYLNHAYQGVMGDMVDVEDSEGLPEGSPNSAAALAASSLVTCCDVIAQKRGRYPLLYTGDWFWHRFLGNAKKVSDQSDAFIAEYITLSDAGPILPVGWLTWKFWQDTSKGNYPGIASATDHDVFHGTLTDLMAWINGSPVPVPPPTPPVGVYTAKLNAYTWVLTMHSGPGVSYSVTGYLTKLVPLTFQVVLIAPNGWGQVSVNGAIKGWVNLACTVKV